MTDARQVVTTYTYDPRNLIKTITYAGSNATATAPVTLNYDAAGNRTQMQDGFGQVTYGYDAASRMRQEIPLPERHKLHAQLHLHTERGLKVLH